jgi:hypothetical protein
MYGVSRIYTRITLYLQRPIVKEFRTWFIRNSKIISMFPIVFLWGDGQYKNDVINRLEKETLEQSQLIAFLKETANKGFRTFDDIPLPILSKLKSGNAFIHLRMNEAYYKEIPSKLNIEKTNYIGSTDFEIYPYELAKGFVVEDSFVALSGQDLYILKNFKDSLGGSKRLLVIKWRKTENKDTIVLQLVVPITNDILEKFKKNN